MENKNLKNLILSIVSYVIIGVLVLYIVFQLVAPKLTIKVFGFKPYIVVTDSMEPEIKINDVVIATNFDIENLEVDDIITFYADVNYDGTEEIVTHYIMSITENGDDYSIRTRRYYEDEADYSPDPWVLNEDSVLGLYSFHIPWIGTVGQFFKSPFGIAAIIVNVGVIVGIVYIIKKSETKQPEQTETK